jgi:ATP-dependent RNA helicase RhlE
VPDQPDEYVHRIGRTGRAKRTGDALTLTTAFDIQQVRAIEFELGIVIPRKKLENFAYKYTALLEDMGDEGLPKAKPRRSLRQG